MCWPHVSRNIGPKIRALPDKRKAKQLLKDVETLQWSSTSEETFKRAYKLLREKYDVESENPEMDSSLKTFFEYFESTWIFSEESRWYEGANPYRCSNNQARVLKEKTQLSRKASLPDPGCHSEHLWKLILILVSYLK